MHNQRVVSYYGIIIYLRSTDHPSLINKARRTLVISGQSQKVVRNEINEHRVVDVFLKYVSKKSNIVNMLVTCLNFLVLCFVSFLNL